LLPERAGGRRRSPAGQWRFAAASLGWVRDAETTVDGKESFTF